MTREIRVDMSRGFRDNGSGQGDSRQGRFAILMLWALGR